MDEASSTLKTLKAARMPAKFKEAASPDVEKVASQSSATEVSTACGAGLTVGGWVRGKRLKFDLILVKLPLVSPRRPASHPYDRSPRPYIRPCPLQAPLALGVKRVNQTLPSPKASDSPVKLEELAGSEGTMLTSTTSAIQVRVLLVACYDLTNIMSERRAGEKGGW